MRKLGITMPFWTWAGKCIICGTFHSKISGLFCANFSSSRSCWSPCNQVWCGACYTPHPWISSKTMYLQMKQDSTGAHKKSRIASTMLGMEIIC